ncbi:hypothetical protein Q765_03520 [Flavobacterium rivuli WB 3.3-2 = DSM 21788]|uniref:Uncharacterized protein n=1 Tax=Flavobacterium rivuli WB 3.3-2 = DSM 21788 TaxID=1121895 RepID=A0A0A2MIJ8_9FLAO|nr:hypothetical protein [Flavobacterium rivuli]KGO88130.1 hypothetical protein Q765_03520 [Flavobacterium rivuli WB 3.3-2 = DSM 21788]
MNIKIEASFSDIPVSKFCYDIDRKKIEIYFPGYHDVQSGDYVEQNCCCVIGNWKEAKSKVYNDDIFFNLDKHIGIFSLLLHIVHSNEFLEMIINTIDDRYIVLRFVASEVTCEVVNF